MSGGLGPGVENGAIFPSGRLRSAPLSEGERGPRALERVLLEEFLHRLLEELLFADLVQRGVVVRDERIDVVQRSAYGILAEVVVEGLEVEERDAVQRPGRLVQIVLAGAVRRRAQRRDQLEPDQAVQALVEQL